MALMGLGEYTVDELLGMANDPNITPSERETVLDALYWTQEYDKLIATSSGSGEEGSIPAGTSTVARAAASLKPPGKAVVCPSGSDIQMSAALGKCVDKYGKPVAPKAQSGLQSIYVIAAMAGLLALVIVSKR